MTGAKPPTIHVNVMSHGLLYDATPLTTRERTRDGFLRGRAVVTRVGVQHYSRHALGLKGGDPNEMVGVYRTPETVFHEDTMASLRLMPVTLGHNRGGVTPQNARALTVGAVGDEVEKHDKDGLAVTIALHGIEGITQVEDGHDQVSGGYMVRRVDAPGEHNGVPYRYITEGPMLYNHLALVTTGRLGDGARVLDDDANDNPEEGTQVADKDGKNKGGEATAPALTTQDLQEFGVTLADGIVKGMLKVLDARDEDAKKQVDADEEREKQIRDGARRRATILSGARALLDEEEFAKVADSEDREILVAVVGDTVTNPKAMSDDYLLAIMDMKVRAAANDAKMKCDGCGKKYMADAKGKCPGCGAKMSKDGSEATDFYDRLKGGAEGTRGGGGGENGRKPTADQSEVEKARKEMLQDMRDGYKFVPAIGG